MTICTGVTRIMSTANREYYFALKYKIFGPGVCQCHDILMQLIFKKNLFLVSMVVETYAVKMISPPIYTGTDCSRVKDYILCKSFYVAVLSSFRKRRDTLHHATTASFHIIPNSLFIFHLTVGR